MCDGDTHYSERLENGAVYDSSFIKSITNKPFYMNIVDTCCFFFFLIIVKVNKDQLSFLLHTSFTKKTTPSLYSISLRDQTKWCG